MLRTKVLLAALFMTLLASLPVGAAVPAEPRALALGGAYTTLATGSEALHWNPAALRANRVGFEIAFPAAGGMQADNTYFSLNNVLLEPKVYDSGEEFLADITGGQLEVTGQGGLHSGVNISSLGVSVRGEANARAVLNKDATRLFAVGAEPGTTYKLDGSGLETIGVVSGGGGLAFALPGVGRGSDYEDALFAVGANVKYYAGLFYASAELTGDIEVSETSDYSADFKLDALYTDYEKVYGSGFTGIESLAGTGYGVDLGFIARTNPKLTYGAVVSNAFSKMTWQNLKRIEGTVKGDLVTAGSGGPELPEDPDDFTSYTESDLASLERKLPMDVRAGVSYRFSPKLLLAADVAKPFTSDGLEHPMSFHVGAELTPFAESSFGRRLALRVGYERNGSQNLYSYGLGFGIWKWEFDAAVRVAGSLAPVDAQGTAFAVASRIRF